MSGEFIDTKVFIYRFDETDTRKREIAEQLVRRALETRSACINHQVVQEMLNVVTRKLPIPMSTENAQRFLQQILMPLWRIMPSQVLYQHALQLQARYRFSFYDALIVAATLESGSTRLYTEDLQHGSENRGIVDRKSFY